MPDIWMDVDTAVEVPCNKVPIVASSDGYTIDETIAYNESGMDLNWNFVTTAGVFTQTNITPTTGDDHDFTHKGNGIYAIEIPASGGDANNDTEGFGWVSWKADAILPSSGPVIGFRAAGLNNVLIDTAYSATRGLAGTALPDAVADDSGGLPISDAGGLDLDTILGRIIGTLAAGTHNPQSGDSYIRIGATGSGLTSLAQASVCTEARLAELDAANIPADIDTLKTRIPSAISLTSGNVHAHVKAEDNIDFGATKKASINTEVDNALDTAISSNPTARSANDMLLRAGTHTTASMSINETSGAYSVKKVNDESSEEIYGGSKAASGTITSSSGTTTRDPT